MMRYDPDKLKEAWSGLFEVAIGVWLLERQLGWVCVMPVVVIICTSFPTSNDWLISSLVKVAHIAILW